MKNKETRNKKTKKKKNRKNKIEKITTEIKNEKNANPLVRVSLG